ncbi:spermine oxidase-like isoform X1 [Danaus plexippus]|uniref:spermine oxidase-like isoform X1 n=1 Tax=Danaus plexippus TaxID=13037 RepID=UPI002AB302C0|nr:spermine oxidase-like isoform X1 [Danaus plexippus]
MASLSEVYLILLFVSSAICTDTMMKYDTIVIGLGAAGTTAASALAKAGKRVLALEAQDRIGGRVQTVPFGDGVVELGAEWIHGTEPSVVYDSAIDNNVMVLPQDIYLNVYKSDGTPGNSELINELVDYALEMTSNITGPARPLGLYLTDKLNEYIKERHPELVHDREFLSEFLSIMDLIVDNLESSNDWYDVSTLTNYRELGGHQHMSWHRHGYKTFFDILLNTYENGPGWPTLDIKLNKEVKLIKWPRDSSGDVEVTCADGSVFTADNVIVTVSLGVLKERKTSLFEPSLPAGKIKAINVIPIGVMNKIMLKFDKLDLPSGNFYGFLWKSEDKARVCPEDGWTTKIFGASTPLSNTNVLTLWTSGIHGLLVEAMPSDVVMKKSMELIRRFMGKVADIPEPTGILMSKWFSNPYTRGSYTYDNLVVTDYPDARATLEAPLRDSTGALKVLFAGEATNSNHFSTVHGASETGLREAKRILPNSKL